MIITLTLFNYKTKLKMIIKLAGIINIQYNVLGSANNYQCKM